MNVLVVGGAGYVGGALTNILEYNECLVYDNLLFEEDYLKNVRFVRGDIRDRAKLKKYLKQADAVVWLAALVGDGACALDPKLTKQINEDSVEWLAKNYNGRIIFMSTCSVYGAQDGVLTEDSPLNPLSDYARTKLAAEKHLKGKNAVIFRLGTLFGLSDEHSRVRFDLVVNTMVSRALTTGKLDVFGGEQYRPLLHVADVANAISLAIYSRRVGTYNLHKENVKIVDLAKRVASATGAAIQITDTTFEDARNYRVNSEKVWQALGFEPSYTVEQGIDEVKQLLMDGRIKDIANPRYSNVNFLERLNGTI